MSASTSSASWKWVTGTLHQYEVSSRSVEAFMTPPTPSMASLISFDVGYRGVPLKHMCSTKCDMPASSGDS